MPFDDFLNRCGVKYTIIRGESVLSEQIGLINTDSTGKKYIGFKPDTDIKVKDCLINPAGEKFYVISLQTQFFEQEPQQLKAYYQNEYEHSNSSVGGTIFNINTVSNSMIGNNNVATFNNQQLLSDIKSKAELDECKEDKKELQQIISLLELIADDKLVPQKGMFSKFSALMEKHSWLTSSVAGIMLNFLTNIIP